MSQTLEQLNSILNNVVTNRGVLEQNIEKLEAQLAVLKNQIGEFDTLTAALQLVISTDEHIEALEDQKALNAETAGSPTLPATGSSEPVAGVEVVAEVEVSNAPVSEAAGDSGSAEPPSSANDTATA